MAQPIRTATGQPYGAAKAQADAQRAAPLPTWEAPVVPLSAPTQRPAEHVMDGVNAGPGRTAAEAGIPGSEMDSSYEGVLNTLRGLHRRYPLTSLGAAIRDFARRPPWTVDDLTLDFNDPTDESVTPVPVFGTRPIQGLFDPDAVLDPSQVVDNRLGTDPARVAAVGVGAAAAANAATVPPEEGEMIPPETATAPPAPPTTRPPQVM